MKFLQEPLCHYSMDRFLIKSPVIYQNQYKIVHIGGGPNRNHPLEINLNIAKMDNVDIIGDAENLPFENDSIDVLISNAVLEHVKDLNKAVAEMKRVLKPNGFVYIEIPFMQHYHTHDSYGVTFEDYRRLTKKGLQETFSFCEPIDVGVCVGPISTALQIVYTLFEDYFESGFLKKIIRNVYYSVGNKLANLDNRLSEEKINKSRIPSGIYFFGMKKGGLSEQILKCDGPNSMFPKDIQAEYKLISKDKKSITIELYNKSKTFWLNNSPALWGTVNLGVQKIWNGEKNLDYRRVSLPKTIGPGEKVEICCEFSEQELTCIDAIKFDLVNEGICWFEDYGNIPLCVDIKNGLSGK